VTRAIVNGAPVDLAPGTTVAEMVAAHVDSQRGIAVAVDREVIPRSAWGTTVVASGATVEIVSAVAGG
jgi:sulfur carrier protein